MSDPVAEKVCAGSFFAVKGMSLEKIKEEILDGVAESYWRKGEVYVKASDGKYYGFRLVVEAFHATFDDLDNACGYDPELMKEITKDFGLEEN